MKWDDQQKKVKEVSSKLRSGIKHQDSRKALNTSVFDCNVKETKKDDDAEYFPGNDEESPKGDELQMSQSLDLMDFISNMDVKPQDKPVDSANAEESKQFGFSEDPFNFDEFTKQIDSAQKESAEPKESDSK